MAHTDIVYVRWVTYGIGSLSFSPHYNMNFQVHSDWSMI